MTIAHGSALQRKQECVSVCKGWRRKKTKLWEIWKKYGRLGDRGMGRFKEGRSVAWANAGAQPTAPYHSVSALGSRSLQRRAYGELMRRGVVLKICCPKMLLPGGFSSAGARVVIFRSSSPPARQGEEFLKMYESIPPHANGQANTSSRLMPDVTAE